MSNPIHTERKPHDEAEALLPWYATGRLDPRDRTLVETHLSSCADCQKQLATERHFVEEFRALAPEIESGWSKIRNQIERREQPRLKIANACAGAWNFMRQPAVAMLAAAQLAFVVMAASLLMWMSRPAYPALGSAPAPAAANMIVIFRADATEEDVRKALGSAGASIVGGPTSAGAYLLHVDAVQRQRAVAMLQSDDEVQMAEPIDGSSQ